MLESAYAENRTSADDIALLASVPLLHRLSLFSYAILCGVRLSSLHRNKWLTGLWFMLVADWRPTRKRKVYPLTLSRFTFLIICVCARSNAAGGNVYTVPPLLA